MSTDTVIVGCKLKHGIWLEVGYDPVTGIRGEKYQRVKINGANQMLKPGDLHTADGVGLTTGVSKDLWDEWLKTHRNLPYVVNGLLFASPEMKSAKAEATEIETEKTGMEPLRPTDDKRIKEKDVRSSIRPYAANS